MSDTCPTCGSATTSSVTCPNCGKWVAPFAPATTSVAHDQPDTSDAAEIASQMLWNYAHPNLARIVATLPDTSDKVVQEAVNACVWGETVCSVSSGYKCPAFIICKGQEDVRNLLRENATLHAHILDLEQQRDAFQQENRALKREKKQQDAVVEVARLLGKCACASCRENECDCDGDSCRWWPLVLAFAALDAKEA